MRINIRVAFLRCLESDAEAKLSDSMATDIKLLPECEISRSFAKKIDATES